MWTQIVAGLGLGLGLGVGDMAVDGRILGPEEGKVLLMDGLVSDGNGPGSKEMPADLLRWKGPYPILPCPIRLQDRRYPDLSSCPSLSEESTPSGI